MTHYKILIFIAFITYCVNYASTLNTENIIGGDYAKRFTLQYQVAIHAIANFSDILITICGGGIIAEYFAVSAAHCFLNSSGDLEDRSFSITVGTIDVWTDVGIDIEVDEIHTAKYDIETKLNDIAVVKLKESLDFKRNWFIKALNLPLEFDTFFENVAVVSGYGFNWVIIDYNEETETEERIDGDTDLLLKYAFVKILNDDICKKNYPHLNTALQICGIMLPDILEEKVGICTGDSGNPLVIGNKLVGIASYNPTDCNDTIKGCIYTKISAYVHFIQGSLKGFPRAYAQVHKNRLYLPPYYSN